MATAGKHTVAAGEDIAVVGGPSPSDSSATSLDRLPPELLLKLFSWLDWSSVLTLDRVSIHCCNAVALHLGKLRLFRVDDSVWSEFCAGERPGLSSQMTELSSQSSEPASGLTALLSMMVELRELHVEVIPSTEHPQDLLAAVVSASVHWPLLERLQVRWCNSFKPDHDLLQKLCANSSRLTNVTFTGAVFNYDTVEAVVTKLPALCTLHVSSSEQSGSFLSQLPTDLRNLTVDCQSLSSWPLTRALLHNEVCDWEPQSWILGQPKPAQLVPALVGCVHLEILSLYYLDDAFVACLPPDGLPSLRHLTISMSSIADTDVDLLVKLLPCLKSVSLRWCDRLTPNGLASLSRLSNLSVLSLRGTEGGVSDWLLTQLSAAPLEMLELPVLPLMDEPICKLHGVSRTLSVDGVLDLIQRCRSLMMLTLTTKLVVAPDSKPTAMHINCGPGVPEQHIVQAIHMCMVQMARWTG